MEEEVFYKRHLPHYHHNTGNYFITFRLANSLPIGIEDKLRNEFEIEIKQINKLVNIEEKIKAEYNCRKVYYDKFDRILNSCKTGELWLNEEKIASMVFNEIKGKESKEVENIAFCIMPNHVHMLIGLNYEKEESKNDDQLHKINQTKLSNLLKLLKGRTA